jgi:hypothetical protein
MKYFLSGLIVFFMVLCGNIYSIDLSLDVDNANTDNMNKYLEYQKEKDRIDIINNNIIRRLDDIFRLYNSNNIYFEFHVGLEEKFSFKPSYLPTANLGFKYNISSPKMINNNDLMSKIEALDELLLENNLTLSETNKARMEKIKLEITEYEKVIFKRLGVGISVPFFPVLSPSVVTDDIIQMAGNYFFYKDVSLFVSADITDFITIEAGFDIIDLDSYYIGFSFDLSSPFNNTFRYFLNYMEQLLYREDKYLP